MPRQGAGGKATSFAALHRLRPTASKPQCDRFCAALSRLVICPQHDPPPLLLLHASSSQCLSLPKCIFCEQILPLGHPNLCPGCPKTPANACLLLFLLRAAVPLLALCHQHLHTTVHVVIEQPDSARQTHWTLAAVHRNGTEM